MPRSRPYSRFVLPLAVGVTSASAALALGQVAGASAEDAPATAALATTPSADTAAAGRAKNVILFVGDGMSEAARRAGQYRWKGLYGQLEMDDMPYSASVKTSPRDPEEVVTDSAAAGTALATGVKTFNGAIGVNAAGRPVQTIGERAKSAGKALGLVTTSQVTDATPASFGAHVSDRSQQDEIARQFIEETRADVILGGGEDRWYPAGNPGKYRDNPPDDPTEESSSTKGNLVRRAKQLGYSYAWNAETLRRAEGPKVLGLFANEEMFQQRPEGEGDQYDPVVPLSTMTEKALQVLGNDRDGFVLVVEEEAIDEMEHSNNGRLTLRAVRELDEAVTVAKRFAAEHPDTLVVTGADHETGGLSVEEVGDEDESGDGVSSEDGPFPVAVRGETRQFTTDWTTTAHTGGNVPFTAMGPGAYRFRGVIENTEVHDLLVRAAFGD